MTGHAMRDDARVGVVGHAQSAAARGGWQQAFDLCMKAEADGLLRREAGVVVLIWRHPGAVATSVLPRPAFQDQKNDEG
jgi:hypothetical protein